MRRAAVSLSIAWRRQSAYHRGGYEPVLRQVDCNGGSCCCRGAVRAAERHDLERSIPQFAKLGTQVLRLRSTRKFFWIGERQGYAVAVFVCHCQGKAEEVSASSHPTPILRSADLRARMRSNSWSKLRKRRVRGLYGAHRLPDTACCHPPD